MRKHFFLFVITCNLGLWAYSVQAQSVDQVTGPQAPGEPVEIHHKRFSGRHHSHKKQKDIEENSNFNLKQAQAIIAHNVENKEENQKSAEKRKQAHMKWLHFLNKGSKDKESKTSKKVQYNFY